MPHVHRQLRPGPQARREASPQATLPAWAETAPPIRIVIPRGSPPANSWRWPPPARRAQPSSATAAADASRRCSPSSSPRASTWRRPISPNPRALPPHRPLGHRRRPLSQSGALPIARKPIPVKSHGRPAASHFAPGRAALCKLLARPDRQSTSKLLGHLPGFTPDFRFSNNCQV